MSDADRLRSFGMSGLLIETELQKIQEEFKHDLGHADSKTEQQDRRYLPQFEETIRREAAEMARHYAVFYCLEQTIRSFIANTLEASQGKTWWTAKVPPEIQKGVGDRIQRDVDAGLSRRSEDPLDYTNFGELGEIIKSNWDLFGGIFDSKKGLEKVITQLNLLRSPIAHCCPLAEDEVLRLRLAMRDWFRLLS